MSSVMSMRSAVAAAQAIKAIQLKVVFSSTPFQEPPAKKMRVGSGGGGGLVCQPPPPFFLERCFKAKPKFKAQAKKTQMEAEIELVDPCSSFLEVKL